MRKRLVRLSVAAVCVAMMAVCAALVACDGSSDGGSGGGDDGGGGDTGLTIADFAGTWAAALFRLTSVENTLNAFELIALGGSLTVTVAADGTFTGSATGIDLTAVPPTMTTIPLSGQFVLVDQTTLTIDFIPEVPPFFTDETMTFTLEGNTLALHDDATTFDFDGNGTEDPAIFDGILNRL